MTSRQSDAPRALIGRADGNRAADAGSIAVELVIIAPLLIALLLFVVGLGRIAHTHGQVGAAAADAARTASFGTVPSRAAWAGEQAAKERLAETACRSLDVDLDTAALRPGGSVTATVRCVLPLGRLGMAGFPGSRTFTASSVAPIDEFRGR